MKGNSPDKDYNTESNKIGTVSIRNMDLEVWYSAMYICKMTGTNSAEYFKKLIKESVAENEEIFRSNSRKY